MISFILYYLSGLTLIVVIALLLISKLFHETYILKGYIRFLLKQPREIEWDSSKVETVLTNIKDWDSSK